MREISVHLVALDVNTNQSLLADCHFRVLLQLAIVHTLHIPQVGHLLLLEAPRRRAGQRLRRSFEFQADVPQPCSYRRKIGVFHGMGTA